MSSFRKVLEFLSGINYDGGSVIYNGWFTSYSSFIEIMLAFIYVYRTKERN